MSDMYYDPSEFDFTNLVDVVETEQGKEPTYTKAKDVGPDGGKVLDASDLNDEFTFPDDEPEADPEFDPNASVSDIMEPDTEAEDTVKIINDLADDVPLDIGGITRTKAQIIENEKRLQRVDQNADFLQFAADTFETDNRVIEEKLTYKDVAVDHNIRYLENCLQSPNLDQATFLDIQEQLKGARAKKTQIEKEAAEILDKRNQQQQQLTRNRWVSTDAKMMEAYPDWLKWRDHLIDDALNRGYKASYIEKAYDPVFAQTLLESYQFRQNKQTAQTKAQAAAKKAQAAKSIANKASTSQLAAADAKTAELRKLKAKMAKGGLSREDLPKMYDHLVD
ncbi:hypothetical protein [Escherichia coli]|uniref:hypothetical protein n=1 Tax=Escherichia coli TaxID=562 RepID=UPI0038B25FA2